MWWKALSVVLLCVAFTAGILVPLIPAIEKVTPEASIRTGESKRLEFHGYNTFFTKSSGTPNAWLSYKGRYVLVGHDIKIENDTLLSAVFDFPKSLPDLQEAYILDARVDDSENGKMDFFNAVKIVRDTSYPSTFDSLWTKGTINEAHEFSGFRFSNIPSNRESIRNLFYHVPMWMVMGLLFMASVWYSIKYLREPDEHNDIKAAIYAETGLLFGFMGLFTGMLWANYTWGAPWSNDVKQLMTVAALLIYVAYFILRSSFDEPEKGARIAAVYNIFAFSSLIPLLYIVPRIFSSLHPGGEGGNPVFSRDDLNINLRVIFYPAILGWVLLGFWIAQLRIRARQIEMHLNDL